LRANVWVGEKKDWKKREKKKRFGKRVRKEKWGVREKFIKEERGATRVAHARRSAGARGGVEGLWQYS
jgi:hypothetical protein